MTCRRTIESHTNDDNRYVHPMTHEIYAELNPVYLTLPSTLIEPTPASNSIRRNFKYVITKPNIQLNRIVINIAMGDERVNAGKRPLPDDCLRIQTHTWRVL